MPFDVKSHLRHLSAAVGPSGLEAPVRDVIRAAWEPYTGTFSTDGLGSLIALKRGSGPEPRRTIMLCAHMDEIALLVAEVRGGFIRTVPVGGTDYRVLLTQPVTVHGRRTLPGVVGAAPPHMSTDRKKYPSAEELWIDVGLPADEVATLVRVGDVISFDSPLVELKGERVSGKSLDNRASVAAVTCCLDELSQRDHGWDVAAVAATQEEVGSHGALAATYRIKPDIAIAIDATYGAQKGADEDVAYALGSGPTISRGPNFHPRLVKAFRDLAKREEIPLQMEAVPGDSGTDAWMIQVSNAGIPTLLIGLPVRHMHTPAEVVDLRDVTRAGRLMAAFIAGLAPDFLDTIAYPIPTPKEQGA